MALPTEAELTSNTTTNAQQKTYFAGLRNFIANVLGTTETAAGARTALGAGAVGSTIFQAATIDAVKTAAPIQAGTAVASSSGTSVDFTSIPSWARRITVMLSGVSTNGTSDLILQLGDSGGIETSGYLCSAVSFGAASLATVNYTTAFVITPNGTAASIQHYGALTLEKQDGNTWVCRGQTATPTGTNFWQTAGAKATSATLDRVRITTAGGVNTFDGGSINIMWE